MTSGNQGWGQAPPFATIPAGNDHPLAGGMTLPPPPPPPPQNTQQQQHPLGPSPSSGNFRGPPPSTVAAAPISAPVMHQPSRQPPPRAKSSSSKTLDALADDLLSLPSYRTRELRLEPLLQPVPLPPDESEVERLRTLVERRAWGDVLKMATSLLGAEMETSPHATVYASLVTLPFDKAPPSAEVVESIPLSVRLETVEIMMVRCHALLKLRRYPDLAAEVERWNFLTQNDATARSPEWLPWSVHVIAGQAHDYFDGTAATKAIDILHQLREKIPSNQPMWLCNVDNALANVFLRRGEFRLAMASLDRIISLIPEAVKAEVALNNTENEDADASCSLLTKAYTCEIYSRQGRILLQAGALFEAADIFESAKILSGEVEASSAHFPTRNNNEVVRLLPCQMQVNEGIFHFSKSRYDHALESFSKAVEILRKDRENNILASKYRSKDWVGPCIVGCQPANVLYNETINNMALSHLYMCKMKDAVDLLEELVCEDPTSFLTERLAFNLCTLYELGSDNATGVRKKKTLQLIAKRFFLHDIGPESFRVQ